MLLKNPKQILGMENERLEKLATILGTICSHKDQCSPETLDKLSVILADMSQDQVCGP